MWPRQFPLLAAGPCSRQALRHNDAGMVLGRWFRRHRETHHPPPRGGGEAVRAALAGLLARSGRVYKKVFLFEGVLSLAPGELRLAEPLVEAGVLEAVGETDFVARARVFPVFEKFIATDLLSHQAPDQVFSLMFEQVYLLRNTAMRHGDEVLELCTGSGVNAIFAAELAASVVATDVNPRALDFARFNQALNAPRGPIEFREGSLFEPLEAGRRFDTILVNPPFEMVPPGEVRFLHSDGGEDGLDVVRAVLAEAPRRLKPQGRFEMITYSPGTDTEPALAEMMEQAFPDHAIELHLLDLEPLSNLLKPFRRHPAFREWCGRLAARGYTTNFFLFVRATAGASRGTRRVDPREEANACRVLAADWA